MAKKSSTKKAAPQQHIVTEDNILDYVFHTLYSNLHLDEMHFQNDIIAPSGLQLEANQLEFIRELVLNTNMINASIGFKKAGYVYLNPTGIQMMKNYKSYSAFAAANRPAQPPPPVTKAATQPAAAAPIKRAIPAKGKSAAKVAAKKTDKKTSNKPVAKKVAAKKVAKKIATKATAKKAAVAKRKR